MKTIKSNYLPIFVILVSIAISSAISIYGFRTYIEPLSHGEVVEATTMNTPF